MPSSFKSPMLFMTFYRRYVYCMTSLGFRDPEIGRGVPNVCASVKNKRTNKILILCMYLYFPPKGGGGGCGGDTLGARQQNNPYHRELD